MRNISKSRSETELSGIKTHYFLVEKNLGNSSKTRVGIKQNIPSYAYE
jgi:hypothetical protein